jgi:MFS family permease
MVLSVVSLVLAILAPSQTWFYLIFFLRGAVNGGGFVSGISIVYEFTDPDNHPTYIGLANTIPGVANSVAPLIGGWLVGAISYTWMFAISMVIGIVSWTMMRFTVREPRKTKSLSVSPAAD